MAWSFLSKKNIRLLVLLVAAAVLLWYGWERYAQRGPGDGFVSGNGRIEATEIDVASKYAGRVSEIMVREGDFVTAGQVVARMQIDTLVALDERGTNLTTKALAERLKGWQLGGDDVALVIGGPDGLDPAFRQAAHERIRLSDLTLPHAMVRVLLIEQLYRAWSVNAGHPYHRE